MATFIGPKTGTLRHVETATDDGIVRTASQTYLVQAANTSETAATIMATSGVPPFFSLFTDDPRLSVKKRQPRRLAKSLLWEVAIEWSSATKKREEDQEEDQPPTERPPIITIDSEIIKRPFVTDVEDSEKRIVASNGQEFLSTPLRDVYVTVINYTRYEDEFPLSRINTFQGTVNDALVTIGDVDYGKKRVLIPRITADNGSEVDGEWVWSVSYQFKLWPEDVDGDDNGGWMRDFLDQGTFYKTDDDETFHFVDDYGNPRTGNLDGSGNQLEDDDDAVLLWFNEHSLVDFTDLQLT